MQPVTPLDAAWLWVESSDGLTHVTGVQVFGPAPDSSPDPSSQDLLDRLHAELIDATRLKPEFRLRPARTWRSAGQYAWETVPVDLADHVHRVRLPIPGGQQELHDHVGRFHSERLDRDLPLWQAHLVEGLEGGGFALVTKIHHALFDGVAASKHFTRGLAAEPGGAGTAPWLEPRRSPGHDRAADSSGSSGSAGWWSLARDVVTAPVTLPASALRTASAVASAGISALTGAVAVPFGAPATSFNGEVERSRSFAGASASLDRLRRVAQAADVSTNDVVLAVCAGGLRRHLLRAGELPRAELTALVSVSRRDSRDSAMIRGNAITSVLCGLATHDPDPTARLRRIHTAMRRNKALASALDPITAAGLLVCTMGGAVVGSLPALPLPARPPFNLTISTVPGNTEPLYWHGCRLIENYPASIVTRGQGLNLTLATHSGRIAVGVTACHGTGVVPDELIADLEAALHELEIAFDAGPNPFEAEGVTGDQGSHARPGADRALVPTT